MPGGGIFSGKEVTYIGPALSVLHDASKYGAAVEIASNRLDATLVLVPCVDRTNAELPRLVLKDMEGAQYEAEVTDSGQEYTHIRLIQLAIMTEKRPCLMPEYPRVDGRFTSLSPTALVHPETPLYFPFTSVADSTIYYLRYDMYPDLQQGTCRLEGYSSARYKAQAIGTPYERATEYHITSL